MQLGGVRSTSHEAKSFMGTGLKLEPEGPVDMRPAMLKLVPEVNIFDEVDTVEGVEEAIAELTGTPLVMEAAFAPPVGGPGGLNPLLTALAIVFLH